MNELEKEYILKEQIQKLNELQLMNTSDLETKYNNLETKYNDLERRLTKEINDLNS